MFVNSTLLGSLDRFNARSIMTSATGSICGLAATIIFIILSFVLFLGPIQLYFAGDFIQSNFQTYQLLKYQMDSGCDFKMAISFYHRLTGKVADHKEIDNFLKTQVYSEEGWNGYFSKYEECRSDYFEGLDGDPMLKPNQCFIVPDNLRYKYDYLFGFFPNIFGFDMQPQCPDPFICTYKSQYKQEQSQRSVTFFDHHYYIIYFTVNTFDDFGNVKQVVHAAFSSEFDVLEDYTAWMFILVHTQRTFMDDTIMPWYNNQTYEFLAWDGFLYPEFIDEEDIAYYGIGAFFQNFPKTEVIFRYYHKLDWLIGVVGGGIFLLFFIFWVPFNYINTVKQKIQVCESLVLEETEPNTEQYFLENLQKPKISWKYYLTNLLPFASKATHRKINYSERMLDIASLIKKQKVTLRNLEKQQISHDFQPKSLTLEDIKEEPDFQNLQVNKLELHQKSITALRELPSLDPIQNNEVALAINGSERAEKKIKDNMKDEKYSKTSNSLGERSTICGKIANFIKFFDVFGAKPLLSPTPHNSTIFSWFVCLFIIIMSVLTFALTIYNMNITRTYTDAYYIEPEDLQLNLTIMENYRLAFCFSYIPFYYGEIIGPDRVVDFMYYQERRNGDKIETQYSDPFWINNDQRNYFELPEDQSIYLRYCLRPPDLQEFEISGSETTDYEAYFGIIIKPYCPGSFSYCEQHKNQTIQNFYKFISERGLEALLPENKYDPMQGKFISKVSPMSLNVEGFYRRNAYNMSIEETVYNDIIELEDDTHNWLIGEKLQPIENTLTTYYRQLFHTSVSVQSPEPYYKFKIKANGQVERVTFSNYKIDFLFAIIGGSFIFYYIVFHWIGKHFNINKVRKMLSQELYTESSEHRWCLTSFFSGCPCSEACRASKSFEDKITNDLDVIGLVRRVDTNYKLSSAFYQTVTQKDLSLIYLKEIVSSEEQIIPENEEEEEEVEVSDYVDFESEEPEKSEDENKESKIESAGNLNFNEEEKMDMPKYIYLNKELQAEDTSSQHQTYKRRSKLEKVLSKTDFFCNKSQLTFEGKRTVQSVCGGISCLILFVLLVLIVQHFLTIYFSEDYSVSQQTISNNRQESNHLNFTVGETFKFAASFFTPGNYTFHNVSEEIKDVGLAMKKTVYERQGGEIIKTQEFIPLEPCSKDYLNGFNANYTDTDYYKDIEKAYCVPDGTVLKSYGLPYDEKSEDFALTIYNKYHNETGNQAVSQFLGKHLLRYHMSVPIKSFKLHGQVQYEMRTFVRTLDLLDGFAFTFNMTLSKARVVFHTAVNPSNEHPEVDFYDYDYDPLSEAGIGMYTDDISFNITFAGSDVTKLYTVRIIKANELFGMIGGVILFIFFGVGAIVRSYNDYRMRYLIGSKLYQIRPPTFPKIKTKRKNGKIIRSEDDGKTKMKEEVLKKMRSQIKQENHFNQFYILFAWFLSLFGFIRSNYNFSNILRLVSLIQYRTSEDMNLYSFYKKLYGCEKGIQESKLFSKNSSEICFPRIFTKHIVRDQYEKLEIDDNFLKNTIEENDLSDWEIKKIYNAKRKKVEIEEVFTEKWLDNYFGFKRLVGPSLSRNSYFDEKIESLNSIGELAKSNSILRSEV